MRQARGKVHSSIASVDRCGGKCYTFFDFQKRSPDPRSRVLGWSPLLSALVAQQVEHVLGKNEVTSSNLVEGL